MDNRSLKQFVTLADTLHFGRASEASNVSPSALSRCIARIEEELCLVVVNSSLLSAALAGQSRTDLRILFRAREDDRRVARSRSTRRHRALERAPAGAFQSLTRARSFMTTLLPTPTAST